MNTPDSIAQFFLSFSNFGTLLVLFMIGFIALDRKIWGQALFLLLLTMILNVLLKDFFQVPLMPHLGKGFAFPSGHMHAAMAFYGWLFVCYRHPALRFLLLTVLIGIGFSLIYFHYHSFIDVMGAVGFGSLSLSIYYPCTRMTVFRKTPPLLGLVLCALAIPMLLFLAQKYFIPSHAWQAFYSLLIFSVIWWLFSRSLEQTAGRQRY